MIELIDLTKKFGDFSAVNSVNLDIQRGNITAFLGPNGAGKTTTLKMLTGLLKPTSGRILVDQIEFESESSDIKKKISYIPDFPFLYEYLTGREFLSFVGAINKIGTDRFNLNRDEYLETFNIQDIQHNLIKTYSHGLKQRLVFCSAFLKDPEILIIDEPMVGLDPKTSSIFKNILKRFALSGGTVFLSTHQLKVAEELADYIAIINKGSIIAKGNTKDLLAQNGKQSLEEYFLKLTD